MTKVLYKQHDIESNVIGELDKSKEMLKIAITEASQFSIPSDFEYQSYLNSLPSTLENVKVEYVAIDGWLKDCIKTFEDASTAIKDDFDTFVPMEIPVDTEGINKLY